MKIIYIEQLSKNILHKINAPHLPFNWGANPYRGCIHSCIYCYARYTHSYLDMSPEKDFETKIFVKLNAPQILRKELSNPKWQNELVNLGSVCDPYQPAERKYGITKKMLQVFEQHNTPLTIATKSDLITRDIELLKEISDKTYLNIVVSLSSLNDIITRELEPHSPSISKRLEMIRKLREADLKVGILMMPIVPLLNDSKKEIESFFAKIAEIRVNFVLPGMLYLQGASKKRFMEFIQLKHPELEHNYKKLYMNRSPPSSYSKPIKDHIKSLIKKYHLYDYNDFKMRKPEQSKIDLWLKK